MAHWEYKVITSGKGGFATPALLETYLNQLGTDEWEIIEFRAQPDNPLAFHGLARRLTQREWTLEAAAAAAAKVEADKLRAEFAAKFQAGTTGVAGAQEPGAAPTEDLKPVRDDSFRPLRDTEYDQDPDALDDSAESEAEEWPEADQLPCFFEAIRPHMRRNQKGPGYSVSVDYLVKKFSMLEDDLTTALKECGFVMPEDEDDKPAYLEYDEDIYWLNVNRRGEIWINTREKPRPVFKVAKGTPLSPEAATEQTGERKEEPAGAKEPSVPNRNDDRNRRRDGRRQQSGGKEHAPQNEGAKQEAAASATPGAAREEAATAPLPGGPELLDKLRPLMRRSRGGWSGTTGYLSRALRCRETDLSAALAALGLQQPASTGEKPATVEIGEYAYWLNKDGRGGVWINVRERKEPAAVEQKSEVGAQETEDRRQETEAGSQEPKASEQEPAKESQATDPKPAAQNQEPEKKIAEPEAGNIEPETTETKPRPESDSTPLAAARLLLKATRTGGFAGEIDRLAEALGKGVEELTAAFVAAGLKVPEKAREKPSFVEQGGEIFWFNKNAKGELWLNAKASKFPSAKGTSTPKKPARSKKKSAAK